MKYLLLAAIMSGCSNARKPYPADNIFLADFYLEKK